VDKVHKTILIDGFRVWSGDYQEFLKNIKNFKHLYYDTNGRGIHPYLPYEIQKPTKNIGGLEYVITGDYIEYGFILDINAYGIVIDGIYTRHREFKGIIYKNWRKELKNWIKGRNENWVYNPGKELLINREFNDIMIKRLHYESHKQ
jgi:hypothetical protein